MTSFEFGDVVLVPFPFTNLETHKQRPAVVVNAADYGSLQPGDVVILAITSQIAKTEGFHLTEWERAVGASKCQFLKNLVQFLPDFKEKTTRRLFLRAR